MYISAIVIAIEHIDDKNTWLTHYSFLLFDQTCISGKWTVVILLDLTNNTDPIYLQVYSIKVCALKKYRYASIMVFLNTLWI